MTWRHGKKKNDAPHIPRTRFEQFRRHLPDYDGAYLVSTLDFEIACEEPRSFGTYEIHQGTHELSLETTRFTIFYPTSIKPSEAVHYYRPKWLAHPQRLLAHSYAKSLGVNEFLCQVLGNILHGATKYTRLTALEGAPLCEVQTEEHHPTVHKGVNEKRKGQAHHLPQEAPVIVFSHGLCGSTRMYSQICGALASFGFMVVSIEHRDGTSPLAAVDPLKATGTLDTWELRESQYHGAAFRRAYKPWVLAVTNDNIGKKAPHWGDPNDKTVIFRRAQLAMRVAEVEEVYKALLKLNAGKLDGSSLVKFRHIGGKQRPMEEWHRAVAQFKQRLDLTENLVIMGHSYGGCTTAEVARFASDPATKARLPFKAGILLDPFTAPLPPCWEDMRPADCDEIKYLKHPGQAGDLPLPRYPIRMPIICILSSLFAEWNEVVPYTRQLVLESLDGENKKAAVLEIMGSVHLSQSDFCLLFERILRMVPYSHAKVRARRVMELNVKASLEFLRQVVDLSSLPLPAHGMESSIFQSTKKEHVLLGEAKEVKIRFSKGLGNDVDPRRRSGMKSEKQLITEEEKRNGPE